eukprot:CAMPEP_0170561354 /NCGR_PEP_ID=MMETSP0211-20121228/54244_1 /TAXON_ID=311385 /ORGANISM="Pseudokeronopsis sp., Strain OXSARD2" /LENGTH=93 /DNA_ID=CAMNT_0010876775 /DNA_START=1 /DNA_END=279 /DNA_ORIENTATION=-
MGVNFLLFLLSRSCNGPVWALAEENKFESEIGIKHVIGALLYGSGWGFSGFCLGPGLAGVLIYPPMLLWLLGVVLGMILVGLIERGSGNDDLH